MSTGNSAIPLIIQKLRRAVTDGADIKKLVAQTFDLLSYEDASDPIYQRYSSEIAFALYKILKDSQGTVFLKFCCDHLLKFGNIGDLLILLLVQKNTHPTKVLTKLLNSYESHDRLRILNLFFHDPSEADSEFLQYAFATAKSIQSDDPEAVLLLLDDVYQQSGECSYPLQREFLKGRFGIWLKQLLDMELEADQLEYMARTVGKLKSSSAAKSLVTQLKTADRDGFEPVFQAVSQCGESGDNTLIKQIASYLTDADKEVRRMALDAMLSLNVDNPAGLLVYMYEKHPDLQHDITLMLLRLSESDFDKFMSRIQEKDRWNIQLYLISVLATLDTANTVGVLDRSLMADSSTSTTPAKIVSAVKDYIMAHPPAEFPPFYKPKKKKGKGGVDDESGILSYIKKVIEQTAGGKEVDGADSIRGLKAGETVENISVGYAALPGSNYEEVTFTRTAFGEIDFSYSTFKKTRFANCRFNDIIFTGSKFLGSSFVNCIFTNCYFSDTFFKKTKFTNCTFNEAHFPAARFDNLQTLSCAFTESNFFGVETDDWINMSCLFHGTDFSYAVFRNSDFQSLEFKYCLFTGTYWNFCTVYGCESTNSLFSQSMVFNPEGDMALIKKASLETRERCLKETVRRIGFIDAPDALKTNEGYFCLNSLLNQWFYEKDVDVREAVFLVENRRRLSWAMGKLTTRSDFLKILPGILETDFLIREDDETPAPICDIAGYRHTYTARKLMHKYLGKEYVPDPGRVYKTGIPIEAIYTIGSLGTIAQTTASDLDLWVCYDAASVTPETESILREKLISLSKWAEATFGLEVHFYLMDLIDVRENDFGFSDNESVGSSQAMILKEEFYRSAIHIAGKKPVWWYFSPAKIEAEYKTALNKIYQTNCRPVQSILDLGVMMGISREEFYGASLWQIVKGLKSPFKSVLKFALMHRYLAGKHAQIPLCNMIMENLLAGKADLWDIDPYAVMFNQVYKYYLETDNKPARMLMRLAFLQKTGFAARYQTTNQTSGIRGYSFMEYFFPYSEADIESRITPVDIDAKGRTQSLSNFHELMGVGKMVRSFMYDTYQSVQEYLSHFDVENAISDEDLTKLGRKIFSYMLAKPRKIMYVPFMHSPKSIISALEFSCEGIPGVNLVWSVRGQVFNQEERKSVYETLNKDKVPIRLLAWLVVNNIYNPEMYIAGNVNKPISIPEISELMERLYRFFPASTTFDTNIDENLGPERVVRVQIIVNFFVAREESRISETWLLYTTNWGELFYRGNTVSNYLLERDVREFLAANIDTFVDQKAVIDIFTPQKAMCPRVTVYDNADYL